MFPEEGVHVHVNSVPATFEVRVTLVAVLLHWFFEGGAFVRMGVG
jgi:hypothetical protein